MRIAEVIEKHYPTFRKMCKRKHTVLNEHLTSEDILQNVMLMAVNKFKDKEISEDEGYDYIKRSLAMELFFNKKKVNDIETLIEDEVCPPKEPLYLI